MFQMFRIYSENAKYCHNTFNFVYALLQINTLEYIKDFVSMFTFSAFCLSRLFTEKQ